MPENSLAIAPELPRHFDEIDQITREVFGPGMFARAAYKLRERVLPEASLSFVALKGNRVVGSVRQTRIWIGNKPALLLGPLCVLPTFKNGGIGKRLMLEAVEAAKTFQHDEDVNLILLVGDLAYYAPFGFKQVSADKIIMPRPVDPGRVLACELSEGALKAAEGEVRAWA